MSSVLLFPARSFVLVSPRGEALSVDTIRHGVTAATLKLTKAHQKGEPLLVDFVKNLGTERTMEVAMWTRDRETGEYYWRFVGLVWKWLEWFPFDLDTASASHAVEAVHLHDVQYAPVSEHAADPAQMRAMLGSRGLLEHVAFRSVTTPTTEP